jgi:chemotaxis signal transduction protein
MKKKETDLESRIIVLDSREFYMGFLVDRIERIETVPVAGATVQESQGENPYIMKVVNLGGRILNVINLEKLLSEVEGYFG